MSTHRADDRSSARRGIGLFEKVSKFVLISDYDDLEERHWGGTHFTSSLEEEEDMIAVRGGLLTEALELLKENMWRECKQN